MLPGDLVTVHCNEKAYQYYVRPDEHTVSIKCDRRGRREPGAKNWVLRYAGSGTVRDAGGGDGFRGEVDFGDIDMTLERLLQEWGDSIATLKVNLLASMAVIP